MKNCFHAQNFTQIGQSAAELWPRTISNMAVVRNLEFQGPKMGSLKSPAHVRFPIGRQYRL